MFHFHFFFFPNKKLDNAITSSQGKTVGNFNRRFQTALESYQKFGNLLYFQPELIYLTKSLVDVASDFIYCVRTYGKIIIAERFLKPEYKTIKPTSVGGIAGGEKFIVNSVLFKFSIDKYGI